MTSFASFVSTDSFNFSADFMFGPITKEDEEVWTAYFLARKRPTKEAKEDFVKNWIASNECYWKGSSLRANHVRHKVQREKEARLVRDAGTVKVVDAKEAKESDQGEEAAPTEESTAAGQRGGRRSSRLAALASKRIAPTYDTASSSSARAAKRRAGSRK